MGQVQNYRYRASYVGQTMLYLINISEQHLSIYEVLIHKMKQFTWTLCILNTEHLPATLISPTQLTHMLDQVKAVLQKMDPEYDLLIQY